MYYASMCNKTTKSYNVFAISFKLSRLFGLNSNAFCKYCNDTGKLDSMRAIKPCRTRNIKRKKERDTERERER